MKIAAQMLNTDPVPTAKSAPALDDVPNFHGALEAAKMVSPENLQSDKQSNKPSAPEARKKTPVAEYSSADPSLATILVPVAPAPAPSVPVPVSDAPSDLLARQPVSGDRGVIATTTQAPDTDPTAIESTSQPAILSSGKNKQFDQLLDRTQIAVPVVENNPDQSIVAGQAPSPTLPYQSAIPTKVVSSDIKPPVPVALPLVQTANDPTPTQGFHGHWNAEAPAPVVRVASAKLQETVANPVLLPKPRSVDELQVQPSPRKELSESKPTETSGGGSLKATAQAADVQPERPIPITRELFKNDTSIQPSLPVITAIAVAQNKGGFSTDDGTTVQIASSSKLKPKTAPSEVQDKSDTEDSKVATPTISSEVGLSFPKTVDASTSLSHGTSDPTNQAAAANVTPILSGASAGTNHGPQSSFVNDTRIETTQSSNSPHVPVDVQPMQGISSAQLTQSMRSSEMKLGMQSTEFGNISITTSLNHQAISAQISIDHTELGKALALHIPAIEEKLGSAYGVQAKVELRESYHHASTNDSGYSSSGQQSRERRQAEQDSPMASTGITFERAANQLRIPPTSLASVSSRLDIRI